MKIAVVVSGWHFPLHFFKAVASQKLPVGWSADLFCISHRDPKYSQEEKKEYLARLGNGYRDQLDKILYKEFASVADIEALGWTYLLCPNTIGDMGNTNQWLEKYDYKKYDVLLISHDDNFILNDRLYTDLLTKKNDWLILTNSTGSPQGLRAWLRFWDRPLNIRGSFEFFKTEVFTLIGGKFDMSDVTLNREGEVYADSSTETLKNWNNTVEPLQKFFKEKKLDARVHALSRTYRVSDYCIEGERGFISYTQAANTRNEDRGLAHVRSMYGLPG